MELILACFRWITLIDVTRELVSAEFSNKQDLCSYQTHQARL